MPLNCVRSVNVPSDGVVKAFTSMDKLGHANQQNPTLTYIFHWLFLTLQYFTILYNSNELTCGKKKLEFTFRVEKKLNKFSTMIETQTFDQIHRIIILIS